MSAAPGSGKTVQAQLYAAAALCPTVWITLGSAERSGRRLVAGLADAFRQHRRPDAETTMRAAFRLDGTVEEAAALVAETVLPEDALLVVDECEHIDLAPDALSVLDVFLEYAPRELRVLLLSRSDPAGPLQRRVMNGTIALVGEAALRLTPEENHELGLLVGSIGSAPHEEIFRATGGWAAGAAFGYRYGLGTEEQAPHDLPSVIMQGILDDLPSAEEQFLLDTSVPEVLTRDVAAALCGPTAHGLWDSLRGRHLPATSVTGGTVVYHALFRAYLHRRLLARDPSRFIQLQLRYADHLASTKRHEEATEHYLAAGSLDRATESANRAVTGLCGRADWETFLRWAEQLGEQRIHHHPLLLSGLVRSLFGHRCFEESLELVRRLDRLGTLRSAMEADPALLATAAWAVQSEPGEARRLLERYDGDHRATVVDFMLRVCTDVVPATPPLGDDWADIERILSWGLLLQGRIAELTKLVPADPAAPVLNPNVVFAAVFAGDTNTALELWHRVPPEIRDRPHSRLVESAMTVFAGDAEAALVAIQTALSDSRKTSFFLAPAYETFSGYVLLRLGRLEDATAVLRASVDRTAGAGQTALLEWAQAFLGFGLLLEGDARTALPLLRESVRSMNRAKRRLFLPLAATCLAEAEHRCGDDEASHEAAELGYHNAALTGTFTTMLDALHELPEVATREAARPSTGQRWRRLVISPTVRSARSRPRSGASETVHLTLQPFGSQRDILVDGVPQHIGVMKIIEVMALLVLNPEGIPRDQVPVALFPDATLRKGGNHFRQALFKFRKITGLSLERTDNTVAIPTGTVVESLDRRFESLVDGASSATGEERVARLRSALDLVTGPYLATSNLGWAEERRNHLDIVQEEARLELARLLVELGDPEAARVECEVILAVNRYSDPAYRLLVRIERAIGSESSVLAAYRRAVGALEELGLEPGDARRLLEHARSG